MTTGQGREDKDGRGTRTLFAVVVVRRGMSDAQKKGRKRNELRTHVARVSPATDG